MEKGKKYLCDKLVCNIILIKDEDCTDIEIAKYCSKSTGVEGHLRRQLSILSQLTSRTTYPRNDSFSSQEKHEKKIENDHKDKEQMEIPVSEKRMNAPEPTTAQLITPKSIQGISAKFKASEAQLLCSVCKQKCHGFGQLPKKFNVEELRLATNKFSAENLLSEGEFYLVYKGILKDGLNVAVKCSKFDSQAPVEFLLKIGFFSHVHHKNIVSLLGFCMEERILVYEYACNRSLAWHLSEINSARLDWHCRYKIALGTARALRYLHEEFCEGGIVHHDIKPENILLTHDFHPMLVGLKFSTWKQNGNDSTTMASKASFGYWGHEDIEHEIVTSKMVLHEFGVILLELITGRRAIDPSNGENIFDWARPHLEDKSYHVLVDPNLGNEVKNFEIMSMIHATRLCIESNVHSQMSKVVGILEDGLLRDPIDRMDVWDM